MSRVRRPNHLPHAGLPFCRDRAGDGSNDPILRTPRRSISQNVGVLSRLALVACMLFAAKPGQASGQVSEASRDTVWVVTLTDGSTLYGQITESTDEQIVLMTEAGARFEIQRAQIEEIRPLVGRIVRGQVWPEDGNRTRLFFGPTGRALHSREGYIGLYELFFSFVAVGVGDRLVLAGGTPVLPGVIGEVFYLAPKVTLINAPRFQLAAGALSFFLTDDIDEGSAGIVYGVGTFGGTDNAVTLGAGWGFALTSDESAVSDEPVLMLGLEQRASRGVKLMSENYYVDGNALVSGGVRLLGQRFSADIGLGAGLGEGDAGCCLPILTAAYRF